MELFEQELRCGGSLDSRFSLKGTTPSYAPDRTFDTEHIRLEIKVDMARQILIGRCTTTLRAIAPSAEMVFDAVDFKLGSVRWNGKNVSHVYKDGKLTVHSRKAAREGERVDVQIDYRVVKPKLGVYFIKPDKSYPRKPTQVWTQGEDEYARYWFPCHDAPHERTTTELIATVPRGFTAVSNGKLIRKSDGKTTVFHWAQKIPHATYLVTLTVGRFSEITDKWGRIPVLYYCEKGREDEAKRAFGKTPRMLEFFSKNIGTPYPYPKYAQVAVADFIYGGMENTSSTTQTDSALLDERAALDYTSDDLVAHELAHQWFGDYLTCKHWSHAWLNESFATYFDALFKRFDKGENEYLYQIRQNSEVYFSEDKERYRLPIVTDLFRRPTDLFDRHLYEKGSVVLYMLHHLLGEKLFWKSIATYVRRNRGGVVETTDLINAIEEATGRNMRRFFDQWVFGIGHPEYKIRSWWDARKKEMCVRTVQSNSDGSERTFFNMPVEFLFLTSSGEKRFREDLTKKSHLFRFKLPSEPSMVLFDPDHRILKKVDFPKKESWLLTQLNRDKSPLGRIAAAHALARVGNKQALESLGRKLLRDSFWAVQAEAAMALGSTRMERAASMLLSALGTIQHPKVRRAIYASLRAFKTRAVMDAVEKRYQKEASYFAEMEGIRLLIANGHPQASDHLKSALKRNSWNEVIRSAALEGLAASHSTDAIPTVLSYTKWGHPPKLRLAAVRSLAEFGAGHEEIQNRLIELTRDKYVLVQAGAVRVLGQTGDERALPVLKKLTSGHLDGRVMRAAEEAIGKISKGFE